MGKEWMRIDSDQGSPIKMPTGISSVFELKYEFFELSISGEGSRNMVLRTPMRQSKLVLYKVHIFLVFFSRIFYF